MPNENGAPTPSEDVRSLDPVALHALATCLLDYWDTGPPRLLVGAVSAQLPSEVTVPANARVLGSLERDDGGVLVVCESEQPAGVLVERYRDQLAAAGWYEPSRPAHGGFTAGTSDSDYASSDAELDTALDLAAVAEHYAAQLVSAGWQLEGRGADPALAWHTWRFVAANGERWQGLFLARTRPTLPGEVLLHLRVDRLGGQPAPA